MQYINVYMKNRVGNISKQVHTLHMIVNIGLKQGKIIFRVETILVFYELHKTDVNIYFMLYFHIINMLRNISAL